MPASKTLSDAELACIKTDDFSHLQFGFEQETQSIAGCTLYNIYTMTNYWATNSVIDVPRLEAAKEAALAVFLDEPERLLRLWTFYGAYFGTVKNIFTTRNPEMATLLPFEFAILEYFKTKNIDFDKFMKLDMYPSDGSAELFRQLEKDKVTTAQILECVIQHPMVHRYIFKLAKEQATINIRTNDYKIPAKIANPEFPYVSTESQNFLQNLFPTLSPLLEAVGDGSVSGVELKPIRPLTYEETQTVTSSMFQMPMLVDTHCSFHIHVSIKNNIAAQYDEKLQMFMCEYIVANLDKVPATCLERWRNTGQLNRYFAFKQGSEKYTFVSFCRRFKTWEFRCFGNIQDQQDAMMCIKLAALAYKYALRRKNRETKAVLAPAVSKSFLILKKTLTACLADPKQTPKEAFTAIAAQDKATRVGRYSKQELVNLTRLSRSNEQRNECQSRVEITDEDAGEAVRLILSKRTA